MALHIQSPTLHSQPLSTRCHKHVWLKMEALQPSGSFKIRGVGAVCEAQARQGKRRLISSSGGNAGLAVAYAGRQLGLKVTVVVPQTTTARARELIELEGAQVIVEGASWAEAHAAAQAMLDTDAAFVHPFDDPVMWHGHSSMIDEVVHAGIAFDSVVLSVGGGGLLSGVAQGLQRHGLDQLPIVAVETVGADSLGQSVLQGCRVELPAITSIATSLGAKQVCAHAYELSRSRPIRPAVVSDEQAIRACFDFLDDHRVLVEPACGAALAVVYGQESVLNGLRSPLVIVCGGSAATWPQLQRWRDERALS